jgi:prepilin-type N-terminal cleavage/methylation domain-containing protein
MSPREVRHRGFTLLELIALIAIAGVLAGVAIPSMASLGSTRAASAARLLASDVLFARERSVATGTRCWLSFDVAGNRYSVLSEDPANPGRVNAVAITAPGTGMPFVQQFGAGEFTGVSIASASIDSGSWLGFDWLGRPLNLAEAALSAAATVVIAGSKTVSVEPETGYVSVSP